MRTVPSTNVNPRPLQGGASSGRARGRRAQAFTLVEVVIALGIIAFAFVPVIGLLPVGLDMSRQAMDATICAQIAQQLTSEVQQTDFTDIASLANVTPYWFDDQGKMVAGGAGGAIYTAAFTVSPTTKLPDSNTINTGKLATVAICVLNTKAGRTDHQNDPTASRDSRKFIVLVPDNGR